jgi:uncharacterized membrane protein YkoI
MLFLAVVVIGKTTTAKPKIDVKQARTIALAKAHGKIEGEELEREEGKLVWSFDIRTSNKTITEVWVDANDGKIVKTELETPAKEAAEKKHEKHP